MAVTSHVTIQTEFSGDVTTKLINSALDNVVSPGETVVATLASGNNTVSPPSVSGVTTSGLLIVPPAGNVNLLTLKGVNGDVGLPLHKTNPTFIALDTTFTSLVISAATTTVGVRFIWS